MILPDEQKQNLIQAALDVRSNAYAPYSHYAVGAALLTRDGAIYTGANVENAAYPTSMCAERSAVFSAVSSGDQAFQAVAVATKNGGTPCGACRQVLSEFGLDIQVIIVDDQGEIRQETTVADLLPGAFQGEDLAD